MDNKVYIRNNLDKLVNFLEKRDHDQIHGLENSVLEEAISENNRYYAEVCVVFYGLRKLIKKRHIYTQKSWKDSEKEIFEKIKETKEKDDLELIYNNILKIQDIISEIDENLGHYVTHIIDNARIKLASTAYAYGLSAAQASELFSCNKEELMSFIGNTKMPDEDKLYESIKKRVHLLDVMKKNENL